MNNLNSNFVSKPLPSTERLVNAQEASVALNLPLYFFINTAKRDSLGIPHYFIHKMVRYRLTELHAWHVARAACVAKESVLRKQTNQAECPSAHLQYGMHAGGAHA